MFVAVAGLDQRIPLHHEFDVYRAGAGKFKCRLEALPFDELPIWLESGIQSLSSVSIEKRSVFLFGLTLFPPTPLGARSGFANPFPAKQTHGIGGDQNCRTGIRKDCWPQSSDTQHRRHEEDGFQAQRDGNVLEDVAHCEA